MMPAAMVGFVRQMRLCRILRMRLCPLLLMSLALAGSSLAQRPGFRISPDGGPVYVESDFTRTFPEPVNAASSLAFGAIVVFWAIRLRGRYRQYAFLSACLPLFAIGSLGGLLYHTFRTERAFLVMDFLPIALLLLATAVWMWWHVLRPRWAIPAVVVPMVVLPRLTMANLGIARPLVIMIGYSSMAALIIPPAVILLIRTRWAHWRLPAAAVVLFVLAITARQLDALAMDVETVRRQMVALVPIGTHFLWHLFGAAAAFCQSWYVYRLTDVLRKDAPTSSNRSAA